MERVENKRISCIGFVSGVVLGATNTGQVHHLPLNSACLTLLGASVRQAENIPDTYIGTGITNFPRICLNRQGNLVFSVESF